MTELAVVYSALILNDGGAEVSVDNMQTLCKAADIQVEGYWFSKFADFLSKKNINELLTNLSAQIQPIGSGENTFVSSTVNNAAVEKVEEKEEEKEEEVDMGGLFDDEDDF